MRVALLFVLFSSVISGCTTEQPWRFRNGAGLGDAPPHRIMASVHEGSECGFACRPPTNRVYCAELMGTEPGPAPDLTTGSEYCFVGIAVDEMGNVIGVGCTSARVGGGGDVDVILSPADGVNRPTRCGPEVMLDAATDSFVTDTGPGDTGGPDAGMQDTGVMDTGVVDTGTPDAGPQDATITVIPGPGGGALVENVVSGMGWSFSYGTVFELNTITGFRYRITPTGGVFGGFSGGGCEGMNPCELTVTGSATIHLSFM